MNTKFSSILFFLFSLISITWIHAHETGEIKGRVVSDIGTVMNDVNISVIGTDKGTYSNSNGYYSITDVPAGEFVLEASAMGYDTATKRIKVQAPKTIVVDIILYQTPLELSEIVIKGDGFRKRNRSETVTTVLLSTIKELHLTSPLDILNLVPGVEIGAYHQGEVADAFSLRGFSGAGHEGQAAIEVDGVSLIEGEGNHDGYAGTLAFATRKGGEYQDLSIKGGSFETVDAQIALGKPFKVGEKALKTNFAAQLYKTDDYKDNSEFFKGNLNGRLVTNLQMPENGTPATELNKA